MEKFISRKVKKTQYIRPVLYCILEHAWCSTYFTVKSLSYEKYNPGVVSTVLKRDVKYASSLLCIEAAYQNWSKLIIRENKIQQADDFRISIKIVHSVSCKPYFLWGWMLQSFIAGQKSHRIHSVDRGTVISPDILSRSDYEHICSWITRKIKRPIKLSTRQSLLNFLLWELA